MRNLYLVIGAQKSGTSSLYGILKQHPQINLAKRKETKFFSNADLYDKGIEFYQSEFFDHNLMDLPKLDIDPGYLFCDFAPERIFGSVGQDVNFVVILRDPAKRAYSQYLMELFRCREDRSFQEAILGEFNNTHATRRKFDHAYIGRGLYYQQIARYLQHFSLEKFQFFVFEEDFVQNREEMIRSLCSFMQIPFEKNLLSLNLKTNPRQKARSKFVNRVLKDGTLNFPALKKYPNYTRWSRKTRYHILKMNSIPDDRKLGKELRHHLIRKYFLDDIQKLEKLIDRDLSVWTDGIESLSSDTLK